MDGQGQSDFAKGMREQGTSRENRAAQGEERIGQLWGALTTPTGPTNANTAVASLASVAVIGLGYVLVRALLLLITLAFAMMLTGPIAVVVAALVTAPLMPLACRGVRFFEAVGQVLRHSLASSYFFAVTWMFVLTAAASFGDGLSRSHSTIPRWLLALGNTMINGRLPGDEVGVAGPAALRTVYGYDGTTILLLLLAITVPPFVWQVLRLRQVCGWINAGWFAVVNLSVVAACCLTIGPRF